MSIEKVNQISSKEQQTNMYLRFHKTNRQEYAAEKQLRMMCQL